MHCSGAGFEMNIHELGNEKLKQREVVHLDIANDTISAKVGFKIMTQIVFRIY